MTSETKLPIEIICPDVNILEKGKLNSNVPAIQVNPESVTVNIATNYNPVLFGDNNLFDTPYNVECETAGLIELYLIRGRKFIEFLYSYRSISKSIPDVIQLEGSEDLKTLRLNDINASILEILRPTIKKLHELATFINESLNEILHFFDNFQTLKTTQPQTSDTFLTLYLELFDVLLCLDYLKDHRSGYLLDFQRYKRCLGNYTSQEDQQEIEFLNTIFEFNETVKGKHYIFTYLKDNLLKIPGHEETILFLVDVCLRCLETEQYITAEDIFKYIRLLPYILVLLDGQADDIKHNVFTHKKLKLSIIQKIFKKYPIIPIYQELNLILVYVLELAPHYNKTMIGSQWSDMYEVKTMNIVPPDYRLINTWKIIREENTKVTLSLLALTSQLQKTPFTKIHNSDNILLSSQVYTVVYDALKMIGKWHMLIKLMLAWKYTHPNVTVVKEGEETSVFPHVLKANPSTSSANTATNAKTMSLGMATTVNNNSPAAASTLNTAGAVSYEESYMYDYDHVLKNNFTPDELSMFIDIIGMVKSTINQFHTYEVTYAPILRYYMHHQTQQLVQGDLVPLLHRVYKRNRHPDLQALSNLRNIVADWIGGVENEKEYIQYSRKQGSYTAVHTPRVVMNTSTQLYLFRATLRHLTDENAPLRQRKSFLSSPEIEKEDLKIVDKYLSESYYYPDILNAHDLFLSFQQFPYLWFKETYFEYSLKPIYIDHHMPWILLNHLITSDCISKDIPLLTNLFYVLDIYNDAIRYAVHIYKYQYLYTEIETEVTYVLDKVISSIAQEAYTYYKSIAVTNAIDKDLKHKLEELKKAPYLSVTVRHFETILKQRQYILLGKTIDFNTILMKHITNLYIDDFETIFQLLESTPIEYGLDEFHFGLNMMRRLYETLHTFFPLEAYNLIYARVNESTNANNYRGRVEIYIFRSLIYDLLPNSSYNYYTQRFVRSPIELCPVEYEPAPSPETVDKLYGKLPHKVIDMTTKLTRGFFGKHHIELLLDIGGYYDISTLIIECLGYITYKIKIISDYIEVLRYDLTPMSLPHMNKGIVECYKLIENKYSHLFDYNDLKMKIFQSFREVGNTLAFMKDLSDVIDIHDQYRYIQLSSLLGLTSSSNASSAHANNGTSGNTDTIIQYSSMSEDENFMRQTPLHKILQALIDSSQASGVSTPTKRIPLINEQLQNEISTTARKLHQLCANSLGFNSIFQFTLKHIQDILEQFHLIRKWQTDKIEYNTFQNTPYMSFQPNLAMGFHSIWSILLFLFNVYDRDASSMEDVKGTPLCDDGQFGHGFSICGCLFLNSLGQKTVYEVFDYSTHILRMKEYQTNMELPVTTTVQKTGTLWTMGSTSNTTTTSTTAGASNTPRTTFSLLSVAGLSTSARNVPTTPDEYKIKLDKFLISAQKQKQLQNILFILFESKIPIKREIVGFVKDLSTHGIVLYKPPKELIAK